jgi:TP901 family phage tail tape measure protein
MNLANIHSTITYNANLTPAQAQIKALTGQIGALNAAFNTLDKSARKTQLSLASTFTAGVGSMGGFTAQTVKAHSAVENFGKGIAANRLSMREYFREAFAGYTKQNSLMKQLAAQQVKYQQSIAVSTGAGQAMMLTPTALAATGNAAALASQKFSIFNELITGGANRLLNFGKNTQWAGRQLMVGFTVPLMMFTAVMSKQFRDLDKELTRFQKVYGSDLGNAFGETTMRMRRQVEELAYSISRTYGIAAKETAALAADIAATGQEGQTLLDSVQQTTRLAVLGEVDRQEAMKATLAIQSAFKQDTNELAESINFLNAVENQTSTTLQDLSSAIPRVGPVIRSLGGDIEDLATLLVAMREGGVPAAEAANALKSGLASLINPTKQASEVAKKFGVDLVGIVEANRGQLMPTIYAVQEALTGLDSFSRSKVIEQIFGKYQFARMTALFDNIGRAGSQTQQVLELASKSSADLAAIANTEIKALTESTNVKFLRSLEELKNSLMPLAETLTETLIPIFETIGKGIRIFSDFFQALPEPVKNFAKYSVAIAALAGPIIMLVGLFGNLIANGIKFGMMITRLGARMTGLRFEKFELLNADVMAAKLGVDNLTSSFVTQEQAMNRLVQIMSRYEASLRRMSTANPAMFIPGAIPAAGGRMPIRRQSGSRGAEFVPGSGRGDKIPAMLEPGEFIVNRAATQKYAPVLVAMNRGSLPGFQEGGSPNRLAHLTGSRSIPITSAMEVASPGARRVLEEMLRQGITEVKAFNNLVVNLSKATNDSLNTEKQGSGVRKSILAAELQEKDRWSTMMKATGVSFDQLQPTIKGITGAMARLEGELINDPQLYKIVETELIKLSNAGDVAAQRLLAMSKQYGTFEYLRTQEGKVRPGRAAFGVRASGVGSYKGGRLAADSWTRESLLNFEKALDQAMAEALRSSSPSKNAELIAKEEGRNIGQGALNGLRAGMAGTVPKTGLESRPLSAAYERENRARLLLEKALIKETQQLGLVADTEARKTALQKKHNIVLENWTKDLATGQWVHRDGTVAGKARTAALEKLAQEEQLLASQQKKLEEIVVIRRRAEDNAKIAAENKTKADNILAQQLQQRAASGFGVGPGGSAGYFRGGTSPYAPPQKSGGTTFLGMPAMPGKTGPAADLDEARKTAGARGMGATNALFAASMVASSLSMLGGVSADAAGKLGLFTTALMTATMLMNTGLGKGAVTNFMGLQSLGGKMTAAAAGRTGMLGSLLGKGGGLLSAAGGPIGIGVAAAVTAAVAGFVLYKNAAEEARLRSIAAFEDPAKTAEYFGKTLVDVGQQMKDLQSNMPEADLEGIDQNLREAVKQDYAGLIEKVRFSGAEAGARELSLAFNKMIASGLSEEDAVAAVKAIAVESGQAGGESFALAYQQGMLKAKTPEEVAKNLSAQFDPKLMEKNAAAIQQSIDVMNRGPLAGIAGNTAEIMDNTFGDILTSATSFAMHINLPFQAVRAGFGAMLPEDNFLRERMDSIFDTSLAQQQIDEAANYTRGIEQLYANLEENLDVSTTQIVGLVETLFSTFKDAPTETMATFDQISKVALAMENVEYDPKPIQDFLNTLDPISAISLNPLIQDNEELALKIMKATTAGMSLQEILQAIQNNTIDVEINVKIRVAELEQTLNTLREDFATGLAEELDIESIDKNITRLSNKVNDLNEEKQKTVDSMNEAFETQQEASEEAIDGLENEIELQQDKIDLNQDEIEAIQERIDKRREESDERVKDLEKEKDLIEESADAYIQSLQKKQRADDFYSQQRKTSLSALEKLASGDVFGFLQERETLSQQAQQFSYDEMISGIEDRKDLEATAIQETIDKEQERQENWEKNQQDRIEKIQDENKKIQDQIDLVQDQIDAEQDLMDQRSKDHEKAVEIYEDDMDEKIEKTQRKLEKEQSYRSEVQKMIDDTAKGEIQSAQELARVLPPEQAKMYITKQKEILKNIYLLEYQKALDENQTPEQAKQRAYNVTAPLINMMTGAKDQGGITPDTIVSYLGVTATNMDGTYYGSTTGSTPSTTTTTTTTTSTPTNTPPPADPTKYNPQLGQSFVDSNGVTWVWNGDRYIAQAANGGHIQYRGGGGKISGPGTSTSDSIPALLSNGEYVVKASSVSKYGTGLMDAINTGKYAEGGYIQKFANGGLSSLFNSKISKSSGSNTPWPEDVDNPYPNDPPVADWTDEQWEKMYQLKFGPVQYVDLSFGRFPMHMLVDTRDLYTSTGPGEDDVAFDAEEYWKRYQKVLKEYTNPKTTWKKLWDKKPGAKAFKDGGMAQSLFENFAQRFAMGGPAELKQSFDKWLGNKAKYYGGWENEGSWSGQMPFGIMMHHTANRLGQTQVDAMRNGWDGIDGPVVQSVVTADGIGHIIGYGDRGTGAGTGTTQYFEPHLQEMASVINDLGSASRAVWQIEVDSDGTTRDFTQAQFDTSARIAAALREWNQWPSFSGRIINHRDWAGYRTDGTARNDTLYPTSTFEANANAIWESGGGATTSSPSTTASGGSQGTTTTTRSISFGPGENPIGDRFLASKLAMLGERTETVTTTTTAGTGTGTTAGTGEPTVTFNNIPDGYTEEHAFKVLDYLKQAAWRPERWKIGWVTAMRESGGQADLYDTGDYGLFQLNQPTWGDESWWDQSQVYDPIWNARMAYQHVSQNGDYWLPWGMKLSPDGTSFSWDWSLYRDNSSDGWVDGWSQAMTDTTQRRTQAFWDSMSITYPSGGTQTQPSSPSSAGQSAYSYASSQVGKPYSLNANPPNSWDCSKLTAWAWAVATGADPSRGYNDSNAKVRLTPYSHTQANEITRRVIGTQGGRITGLSIGDVLYFKGINSPSGGHTSMYAGNDQVVEASSPETGVRTAPLNSSWNLTYFAHGGPPKGYAMGGFISGPGTPTSDSIPALLSNGEYVVRASSVNKYGKGFMDKVNSGQLGVSGFANGGLVGTSMPSAPTFSMPSMPAVGSDEIVNSVNNVMGGSSSNSSANSSSVKIVINAARGQSTTAIANEVVKLINKSNDRRNYSRSI